MTSLGNNRFLNCSLPLAFAGRYFILEPGNPDPLISVVVEHEGEPVFEVLKNQPQDTVFTVAEKTPPGIVTVSNRETKRFLYKIRPSSETSVVFGTIQGDEITVRLNDKSIKVNNITISKTDFNGVEAAIVVYENGSVGVGCSLPDKVRKWFK